MHALLVDFITRNGRLLELSPTIDRLSVIYYVNILFRVLSEQDPGEIRGTIQTAVARKLNGIVPVCSEKEIRPRKG